MQADAVDAGIHPMVAATTPHDELVAAIHAAPVLRVVADVEVTETWVDRMLAEGFGPDEVASVATFRRGTLVESIFRADEFTPWDEHDGTGLWGGGGDAA